MNATICSYCRLALRRTICSPRNSRQQTTAAQSTVPASLTRPSRTQPSSSSSHAADTTTTPDLASLLSQPTWSVRSLLPPGARSPSPPPTDITPSTLRHLLRLSALPPPRTPDEESRMLATLSSQLHFVRAVQRVDTAGVTPLRAIRDETAAGLCEQTIGLDALRDALGSEDMVGHARRPRRRRARGLAHAPQQQSSLPRKDEKAVGRHIAQGYERTHQQRWSPNEEEAWNVLGGASETAGGRYFVVRSGGTSSSPNGAVE